MKRMILRTAIIAALAITLLAGNAMANSCPLDNSGHLCGQLYLYGWTVSNLEIVNGNVVGYTIGNLPPGMIYGNPQFDFVKHLDNSSGITTDFPASSYFGYNDGSMNYPEFMGTITSNIANFDGTFTTFDLWITGVGNIDQQPGDYSNGIGKFSFDLVGYIVSDDYTTTQMSIGVVATASGTQYLNEVYSLAYNLVAYGEGGFKCDASHPLWNPITQSCGFDEVPEPGTLVLFGTGLLGAAIVARKKLTK
jgi:hypothetical protein